MKLSGKLHRVIPVSVSFVVGVVEVICLFFPRKLVIIDTEYGYEFCRVQFMFCFFILAHLSLQQIAVSAQALEVVDGLCFGLQDTCIVVEVVFVVAHESLCGAAVDTRLSFDLLCNIIADGSFGFVFIFQCVMDENADDSLFAFVVAEERGPKLVELVDDVVHPVGYIVISFVAIVVDSGVAEHT